MRCQAERERMYFDLKFDRAIQHSNGVRGSKYSAYHSRLSVLLISLSYLIPTVKLSFIDFQFRRVGKKAAPKVEHLEFFIQHHVEVQFIPPPLCTKS